MTQPEPAARPLSLPMAIGLGAVALLTPLILVLAVLGTAGDEGADGPSEPPAAPEQHELDEDRDPDR